MLSVPEGNEEKAIPSSQFSEAEKEGWRKQYQYKVGKKKIWLTEDAVAKKDLKRISREPKSTKAENPATAEWNSKDSLMRWRENWAKMCNQALRENNIDAQIDHRSYEDQGINKIAQVHLGVDAFHAEKKGPKTELGELNRQIKSDNDFLSRFEKQIEELERKETERVKKTAARLETLRANHIAAAYQQLCLSMALAQQQDNRYTQIQTSAALAKSADRLLKARTRIRSGNHRIKKETDPTPKGHPIAGIQGILYISEREQGAYARDPTADPREPP